MNVAMAALTLLSALDLSQAPSTISYQGRLLGQNGTPVSGIVDILFAIHSAGAGGTPLWTEQQRLAFTDGYYATTLGSTNAIPATLFDGTTRYLSLTVGGSEMTPRQGIDSVPYALRCAVASDLVPGSAHYIQSGTTPQSASLSISGSATASSVVLLPGAPPASATAGTLVYDAVDGPKVYDGTSWHNLVRPNRTVASFKGDLGPDLSFEGFTQCYGWANDGARAGAKYADIRTACGAGTTVLFAGHRCGSGTLVRHLAELGQAFSNFLPTTIPATMTSYDDFDLMKRYTFAVNGNAGWVLLAVRGNRWSDPGRLWQPSTEGDASPFGGHVLSQEGNQEHDQSSCATDRYYIYIRVP
jgi:hypothetical protein